MLNKQQSQMLLTVCNPAHQYSSPTQDHLM